MFTLTMGLKVRLTDTMPSVFTKMLKSEEPCHLLFEDSEFFAILEKRPVNPGHALVILKEEINYLFDIDDAVLGRMMTFSKKVARAIQAVVPCRKVGVMVGGLIVPHAHIHLIPILENVAELSFGRAKPASETELTEMAQKIRVVMKE